MSKIRQYTYYITIAVASLICVCFVPMVGSEVGIGWKLPTTTVGWIIWATTKVMVSGLNVLIFYSFIQQGKLNISEDPRYLEAIKKHGKLKDNKYRPRSPQQFLGREYGFKGATIFLSTAMATVALTQAILSYDYMSVITYVVTIVMGIVFGILEMRKVEVFWTTEYCDYVNLLEANNDSNRQ